MTTSKPSQATLFAVGSDERLLTTDGLFTTPVAHDADAMRTTRYRQGGTPLTMQLSASSPEAIPASHSRSPGSAWARRMTAISGRGLRRWLPTSSLAAVFSRMFTDTSRWGSTRCWLTWSRSVTPAGRSLFRLRPSAPRTGEIASGFWPTPNVGVGGNNCELTPHKGHFLRPSGHKAHLGLDQAVKLYPTPTTNDAKNNGAPSQMERNSLALNALVMPPTPRHEGFDAGGHRCTTDSLHSHVKMFPTPRAIYGEHSGMSDPSHLTGAAGASPTTGKLSAAWVSRLMGYPDGWLSLPDGTPDPET